MNIFQISDGSDFESAGIVPKGLFTMPTLNCKHCGCDGEKSYIWYASLQPKEGEPCPIDISTIPETVENYEEFVAVRERVRKAFGTDKLLPPGSIIGMQPIEVTSRGNIGDLVTKKLLQGIDFIGAMQSYVVSERVANLLTDCGLNIPMSPVVFRTKRKTYTNYRVIELEPKLTWTREEQAKYQLLACEYCYSAYRQARGGTFAKKRQAYGFFSGSYALVASRDGKGLLINEALRDRLASLQPTGVSFQKVGDCAPEGGIYYEPPKPNRINVFSLANPIYPEQCTWSEATGLFRMPHFDCKKCGMAGATTEIWYASLQVKHPERLGYPLGEIPETVDNYEAFARFREQVRQACDTNLLLPPGSIIGAKPVPVKEEPEYITRLNPEKLERSVDFIRFAYSWAVSDRVAILLRECGLNITLSPICFQTPEKTYSDYWVLELEPQLAWLEEQHQRYQISFCPDCGSVQKDFGKEEFAQKLFNDALFNNEYTLFQSLENQRVLVSKTLRDRLEKMNLNGASYSFCGYYEEPSAKPLA